MPSGEETMSLSKMICMLLGTMVSNQMRLAAEDLTLNPAPAILHRLKLCLTAIQGCGGGDSTTLPGGRTEPRRGEVIVTLRDGLEHIRGARVQLDDEPLQNARVCSGYDRRNVHLA